jgi:1-acyl-sn-glycerol-3-phosphate acyltransferase
MKIFALFNWIYFTVIIFISLGLTIIFFYILPRPYSRKLSAKIIKIATFISTDIKGKEDPDTQLFLLNHQSDLDIFIMEYISSKDLAWVAKKELFDIPFFGLVLKLPKDIAVERESKMALLSLIKDASRVLEKKRTITMFPEGTRSTKGKMLPFKSGAKIIADKYKLKVQPVVLINTSKHFNIKKFHAQSGTIKIIFLPSFIADKNDDNWLKNLRKTMQEVYDNELTNNSSNR